MAERTRRKGFWKRIHFPSALTLLFFIIAIMAVLTWVVPSGQYQVGEDGETPIAGTYEGVEKTTTEVNPDTDKEEVVNDVRQGAWEILQAPVKGFMDAVDVVGFVLVIGGFLAVVTKTGALNAGVGKVVRKLRGRKNWIIPILMTLFAIGGTTYGMQEETIAFYALVVPLVIAAGFDAMTAVMIIVYGSIIGVIASTVNPFSTGIASGFADVSIGDGIMPRLVILVLSLIAGIWFTMRHAKKAAKRRQDLEAADKTNTREYREMVPEVSEEEAAATKAASATPRFDRKRKAVLWVFALTFLIMIITVIPWAFKFNITFFEDAAAWLYNVPVLGPVVGHVVPFGDWWFGEMASLFLLSSFIISRIAKMKEGEYTDTFVMGAKDLLAVALIIAVSRGISIIMQDGMISSTIIHWGEEWLSGLDGSVFGVLTYIFYLPLSFLVPSTSGLATLSMPVMAPIADFAGVGRDVVVTAFQTSSGLLNMIAPTVGALMGGLALAKVSYGSYLRKSWPLFILLAVISMGVIAVVAAM
jgi:uncharacterized ion transporter superfamily protein YfcC